MDFKLNLSEEEFGRLMTEIDERLVSEDVKIPARQIRGWMLFCEKQQLHGISFTHAISTKVMDWFKARYGDRINLDFGLGHSVELIRGDVLRSSCNVFFGRIHVVCHAALLGCSTKGPAVNRAAVVNVLDRVEGMTAPFGGSLTPEERQNLLRGYAVSQLHLSRIGDLAGPSFVPEARADFRESVEHMVRHDPQFGLSKWASLQAAEKFLKAYIVQQGTKPKWIHVLRELADVAESLGLRPIPRTVVALAECSPWARYEAASVSRAEAIDGYHAAVEIAGGIALQLNGSSVWRTEIHGDGVLTVAGLEERIPMIAMRRFAVKSPLDRV